MPKKINALIWCRPKPGDLEQWLQKMGAGATYHQGTYLDGTGHSLEAEKQRRRAEYVEIRGNSQGNDSRKARKAAHCSNQYSGERR